MSNVYLRTTCTGLHLGPGLPGTSDKHGRTVIDFVPAPHKRGTTATYGYAILDDAEAGFARAMSWVNGPGCPTVDVISAEAYEIDMIIAGAAMRKDSYMPAESTPAEKKRFQDFYAKQQTNPDEPAPPTGPRASKLGAYLRGKLAGQPTADAGGPDEAKADQAPAQAMSAEDEARDRLGDDQDLMAALDDEKDPAHAAAVRLLAAYTKIIEIERKKAGNAN